MTRSVPLPDATVVVHSTATGRYDLMDASDTQSLHALTDKQMTVLVSIALQEFGLQLLRPQFNDVMLGLFEHIPGFETLPRKRSQQYLKLL